MELHLKAITEGDDAAVVDFVNHLTEHERIQLARLAVSSLAFAAEEFKVDTVAIGALRKLSMDYKLKKADAQLEASLSGDKKQAMALISLDGYISCLDFLISVALDNNTVNEESQPQQDEQS